MKNGYTVANELERAYDLAAPHYDGWKWQDFWRRHEAPFVLDQIRNHSSTQSKGRFLDVGCGTGYYLSATQGLFRESVGLDISREMLSIAHKHAPTAHLVHGSVDGFRSTEQFDVVMATRVVSHFDQWKTLLTSVRRLLKRDGLLIITGIHSSHNYTCTRLPTQQGQLSAVTFKHDERAMFDYLSQVGFVNSNIVEIEGDGNCGEAGAAASAPVGWAAAMQLF